MENFSKFFDDAVKTNTLRQSNPIQTAYINDNNIYYNINNISSDPNQFLTFPVEDYYLLSNEIILGASKLYNELYESRSIPYAYIAFYLTEFSKSSKVQSGYLKKFLLLFNNKKDNISNAVNVFIRLYKQDAEIKIVNKLSMFNSLKAGTYLYVSSGLLSKTTAYSDKIDENLKNAINETKKIINDITDTVKENNLKAKYLSFLSEESATKTTIPTINEIKLYGEKSKLNTNHKKKNVITPPKQDREEKVTNISLPKLNLGRVFPTSFTHSRIDSAHFAFKFMEADRAYQLIKRYKFSKANYNDGFETKRKSLFETKKSSFDLF